MSRKDEIIDVFAKVYPDMPVDEIADMADCLTWAEPCDVEAALRHHRNHDHRKPKLPHLKAIINAKRGTQTRREPPADKSHAEILADELKMLPAAAVLTYWRGIWQRYATDAVQREASLPADGPGRNLFELQLAGMRRKVVSGAIAALTGLGASFAHAQSLAEQVTGPTEAFDKSIAWLTRNQLPRVASSASAPRVRRQIFGEIDQILRQVEPLVDPNDKHRQIMALASTPPAASEVSS